MRKSTLAAVGFGLLALGACNKGSQDQLNQSDIDETRAADLNALSDEAARVANEAQALEDHAEALNQEAQATDNATGAETPADENIQGM